MHPYDTLTYSYKTIHVMQYLFFRIYLHKKTREHYYYYYYRTKFCSKLMDVDFCSVLSKFKITSRKQK